MITQLALIALVVPALMQSSRLAVVSAATIALAFYMG